MKKRQIPHTYSIIFYIILFCAALTWIIPGGQYKESINAAGEKTVVYEAVEHVPQTWQVFSAFYKGFVDKADIIVFILIIGGAFWIVNDSKAFDTAWPADLAAFDGIWCDSTLQELLIFQSGTCRVVIPYLDYYGETAFSARLRDRGGMGWSVV